MLPTAIYNSNFKYLCSKTLAIIPLDSNESLKLPEFGTTIQGLSICVDTKILLFLSEFFENIRLGILNFLDFFHNKVETPQLVATILSTQILPFFGVLFRRPNGVNMVISDDEMNEVKASRPPAV